MSVAFVTGGSGFIGGRLIERLRADGHDVRALARSDQAAERIRARGGVRRFVHVGTEVALLAGEPLIDVDETAPLRPDSPVLYSSTKARAEQLVPRRQPDRV
jgi:nucleoside-diphosphate-sugar epimerase